MNCSLTPATVEARLTAALDACRAADTAVALNVMTCCRGCTTTEDIGAENDDQPTAWHFGGQGFKLVWRDGAAFTEDDEARYTEDDCECGDIDCDGDHGEDEDGEPIDCNCRPIYEDGNCPACCELASPSPARLRPTDYLYFNHSNGGGEVLAEALRGQGFAVEWDGSPELAVKVLL